MQVGDLVRVRNRSLVSFKRMGIIVGQNKDYPQFTGARFSVVMGSSNVSNFPEDWLEVINENR